MKTYLLFFSLFILISCEESVPEITFSNKIQGKEINISNKIEHQFYVKRNSDTISYSLAFDNSKLLNYLIKSDTDTVFTGTITKRNELFLLNRTLENGNIAIHALEFTDSTVTGLETEYYQAILMQDELNNIKTLSITTDTSSKKSLINVDKKNAKKLFRTIIDKLDAEPLVHLKQNKNENSIPEPTPTFDTTISELLIEKVFPNPFSSTLNIIMENRSDYKGQLFDQNQKLLYAFNFFSNSHQIDLPLLPKGLYFLEIKDKKTNAKEVTKVIKN